MPRTINVYDPNRQPPEWNLLLTVAEVAVFIEDTNRKIPLQTSTGEPTCEIFADQESAEIHCKDVIGRNPTFVASY